MDSAIMKIKVFGSLVFSMLATLLGGVDDMLILLVALAALDVLTGVVVAVINKKLSSEAMTLGIIKKLMLALVIMLACVMDRVLIGFTGNQLHFMGMELTIRVVFIVYLCLEEGISLLENFGNIGVPYPRWLKEVLVQISDGVNNSTPTQVIGFINKFLGDKFIAEGMFKPAVTAPEEVHYEPDPDNDIKECPSKEEEYCEEEEEC